MAASPPAASGSAVVPEQPLPAPLEDSEFTRFERARILGARALQLSLGAPILIDVLPAMVDPVEIAESEFASGRIPITVRRGPRSS
ncbi:MAG: DNA-directed RNA polymerase subunit K [Thermoplasmata archaeon]